MEVDMLAMALIALENLADPSRLVFLVLGVLFGLVVGVVPGLGGVAGLSLLLPFTFTMDPYTALAFLIGLQAVVATSDTIPAVLFGVPGTVGATATVLDGHPMARRGEAGRAFGAAYTASVLGGLFGALLLGLSIPILRPVVLNIGSPELLSFTIFGLSLIAVLSGSTPLKGLVVACIGLMLATIGDDPQTGTLRWTFGTLYLWDGMPIVVVALGLFALPELADLAISRRRIVSHGVDQAHRGQMRGIRDVLSRPFLVLRCSWIGAALGAVPGIGAAVIDWIAYGHAARTEKDAAKTFGKGDVRGLIAAESANNSKEGGALVPTIGFGIPGSPSMAILLGAFLVHGIVPGPDMLNTRLDLTYTLVWSVALANVLGAGICFAFAGQIARIALVRVGILVPVVLAVVYVGALQGSHQWGDLYLLLGFGVLGWAMKRLRWPRPPLILGFVLGGLFERYMFISIERYGASWLLHPIVLAVFALTLFGLLRPAVRAYRTRRRDSVQRVFAFQPQRFGLDLVFAAGLVAIFAATLFISGQWPFGARLVPQVIAWAAVIFLCLHLAATVSLAPRPRTAPEGTAGAPQAEDMHFDLSEEFTDLDRLEMMRRALTYFAWCALLLGVAMMIGILPAVLLFLIGYIRLSGRETWSVTLYVAIPAFVFAYVLFHRVLLVPWPQTLLGTWFPAINAYRPIAIF